MIYRVSIDNDVSQAEPTYIPIHDPDRASSGYIAYSKSFTKELNKAGSFKFSVAPDNPSYNYIYKLRSTVYVTNDNVMVWLGRVVSIHDDLYGIRNVTCEGALAFLSDILIKPYYYPITQSVITPGVSVGEHISHIMSLYNSRCSAKRRLTVEANLPTALSNKNSYAITGVESYTSVFDELTNCLQYESTLRMSIEFAASYKLSIKMVPFGECDNEIVLTKNLIDASFDVDGSEIYTSLIPLDSDNRSFDFGNGVYYVDNGNKDTYGVIERSLSIGDVGNIAASFVQNACAEVLTKEFQTLDYPKITVTAIDLYNLGFTVDLGLTPSEAIDVGYKVHILMPNIGLDAYYVCTSLTNNLEEPDASTFTFEYFPDIPSELTRRGLRSDDVPVSANVGDQHTIQNGTITEQVCNTFKRVKKDELTIRRYPDDIRYVEGDQTYVPPSIVQGETFDTCTEIWLDEADTTVEVKKAVFGIGVINDHPSRIVLPNGHVINLTGF